MDQIRQYGRGSDQEAVLSLTERLSLIIGDSGIGKSAFLSTLDGFWPTHALISRPIVLKSVEGALQNAIADGISDCIATYLRDDSQSSRAWTVIDAMARRAGRVTGREIGAAVVSSAVELLESKLGKEAVALGRAVLGDALKGGALGLDDRLSSIRATDLAQELCDLLAELSDVTQRPVVIRLDNAERLSPPDHRLLAELASALSGDVRLIVCVTPHHAEGDEVVRLAQSRGAGSHSLHALSRAAIDDWLGQANVPRSQWDAIARLSSGYPFFIADAVRAVANGESLDEINAPDGFDALMRDTWSRVSLPIQHIVVRLSAFIDPPPDAFVAGYLGQDLLQWGLTRRSLAELGVFVQRADGRLWFHDRRRDFIWSRVLDTAQRSHVAREALVTLTEALESEDGVPEWLPPSTALLSRCAVRADGDGLSSVLALTDASIAVLWGLLEVMEPSGQLHGFVGISEVLRYTEARANIKIDPLETIGSLERLGLTKAVEVDDTRLIRATLPTAIEYATLLGEIYLRFHAAPRPGFASHAFARYIQPQLPAFDRAVISLGRATLLDHKENAAGLRDPKKFRMESDTPALGATIIVDDQPVSFTAKFSTWEQRDAAVDRLGALSATSPYVDVDRLVPLPQTRIRYGTYREGVAASGLKRDRTTVATATDIADYLDLLVTCSGALQQVSTHEELEVLGLGRRRYLLDGQGAPESWTSFELSTESSERTRQLPQELIVSARSPLFEVHLRADGYLRGQERILRTTSHFRSTGSIEHPMTDLLESIEKAGRSFNSGLRSVLVPPIANLLQREIMRERERVWAIADALTAAGLVDNPPRRRSLMISFGEHKDSPFGSDFGSWFATVLEVDDGKGEVIVLEQTNPARSNAEWGAPVPAEFATHAGAEVARRHDGFADAVLTPLLGFGRDDHLHFTDLQSPLGEKLRGSRSYDVLGELSDPL